MSISPRRRITALVQQSVRRGIAVIVAAAGYGKTEAVRDCFGDGARYLTVEANHGGPEALARLIITGVVPRRAGGLAAVLQQPQTSDSARHLSSWVAAQLRTVELPIVVDDFHHIDDDVSIAFIRHVVEHTTPRVQWVIISREEPRLPLASWLGRGWTEMPITQDDLEFAESEALELARATGSHIDQVALIELLRDTSGWPIALRLGLSAWERTRAVPQTRLRTRDLLFPFIGDEIWRDLSDADQWFLRACALLSEPRAAWLEAAGFANASARLPALHRRVPLVLKYGENDYRLHEVFREFIGETLRDVPDQRDELVARLAAVLEANGEAAGALKLLLDGRHACGVIALLREHGFRLLDEGRRADVQSAFALLGSASNGHPELLGLRACAQLLAGHASGADLLLRRALDLGAHGRARVEIQRRLARLLTNLGRPADAIALLEDAVASIPPESETSIEICAALAGSYAASGRFDDGRRLVAETASRSRTLDDTPARARTDQLLAYAAFYAEDYAEAEMFANSAAQSAAQAGLERIAAISYSILLAIADATSPYPEEMGIRSHQMQRFAAAAGDRTLLEAALLRRLTHTAHVADDEAYAEISAELLRLGRHSSLNVPMPDRIARTKYDVGNGRISAAIAGWSLADTKGFTETERALRQSILGFLYAALRDEEKADECLAKPPLVALAGDLFERRYLAYAIAFRAAGLWLLDRTTLAKRAIRYDERGLAEFDIILMNVISSICRSPRRSTTREQLVQLTDPLTAFGWHGWARMLRRAADVPETPLLLTPTELDILAELRVGGTAAEVADRLGRRKSTLDWHLKSIYRKIGCHGRSEAVSFAERMGWLPAGRP